MSKSDSLWDKTKTNFKHFSNELQLWKLGMQIHLEDFKHASGVADKGHKAMNLVKESFALLPYTLSHIFVYSLIGVIGWYSWPAVSSLLTGFIQ